MAFHRDGAGCADCILAQELCFFMPLWTVSVQGDRCHGGSFELRTYINNWRIIDKKVMCLLKLTMKWSWWQNVSSYIWGSAVCLFRKGTFVASLICSLGFLLTQLKLSQGNTAFQIQLEEKQLEYCHEKLSRIEEQGEGEMAPVQYIQNPGIYYTVIIQNTLFQCWISY